MPASGTMLTHKIVSFAALVVLTAMLILDQTAHNLRKIGNNRQQFDRAARKYRKNKHWGECAEIPTTEPCG